MSREYRLCAKRWMTVTITIMMVSMVLVPSSLLGYEGGDESKADSYAIFGYSSAGVGSVENCSLDSYSALGVKVRSWRYQDSGEIASEPQITGSMTPSGLGQTTDIVDNGLGNGTGGYGRSWVYLGFSIDAAGFSYWAHSAPWDNLIIEIANNSAAGGYSTSCNITLNTADYFIGDLATNGGKVELHKIGGVFGNGVSGTDYFNATRVSPTQTDLQWPAIPDEWDNVYGYRVYRNSTSEPWHAITNLTSGNSTTGFTDNTCSPATNYNYRFSVLYNGAQAGTEDITTVVESLYPSYSVVSNPNPFVVSTTPANGTSGVALGTNYVIEFSEPMNNGVGAANVVPAPLTAGAWAWDGTGMWYNYTGATWQESTTYYVNLTGFEDLDALALTGNTQFEFTTLDVNPTVTPTPADGATGVATNVDYVLAFSEPMNTGTGSASVQPAPPVAGGWAWDGTGMWYNYTGATWAEQTMYYVNLTGFEDPLANAVTGDVEFVMTIGDFTAPGVTPNPANNSVGQALNVDYSLAFDEPMNNAVGSVTIQPAPLTAGSWAWDAGNMWYNYTGAAWAEVTTYYVNLTGFTDDSANALAGDMMFEFSTIGVNPTVAPTPADFATGVGLNVDYVLAFSEAMNTGFGVANVEPTPPVAGVWAWDGTGMWYNYTGATWLESTTYYVNLTGFQDMQTFTLASDYQFNFTTMDVPPTVAPTPSDGAAGVALNVNYVLAFSEPMNTGAGAATVEPTPPTPGAWGWDGTGMWYNYTGATWLESTTYYVNLTGFEDLLANAVTGDVEFLFDTVGNNPAVAPTPADGAVGQALNVNYILAFTEPMDTGNGAVTIQPAPDVAGVWAWNATGEYYNYTGATWHESTMYYVNLTGFTDVLANPVAGDVEFVFTTLGVQPTVAPTPANNTVGQALNVAYSLAFSEPMDTGAGSVTIEPAPDVAGAWAWDGTGMWYNYTGTTWHESTMYYVNLTGFTDVLANALTGDMQFVFTTLGVQPTVLPTPADGAVGQALNVAYSLAFSEQMNTGNGAVTIEPAPDVAGAWAWDASGMWYNYTGATWHESTMYYVNLTGFTDVLANALTGAMQFDFTTLGVQPTVAPTPGDGAAGQLLGIDYVLAFSEQMNTGAGTPTIEPAPPTLGAWAWDGTGMWYNYTGATWLESSTYYINLTGFEDVLANALTGDMQFVFSTIGVSPEVATTTPLDGATSVALAAGTYVIEFNEAMMQTGTVASDLPGVSWVWDASGIWLNGSYNGLTESTTYNIDLSTGGFQDIFGNPLVAGGYGWTFSFDTVGVNPEITLTNPADSDSGVLITSDIVIIFSEPMNTGSVTWNIAPPVGGATWTPVWSGGNTILTLSHDLDYAELTTYTVTVTAGNDLAGNPLAAGAVPNPWSFTTGDAVVYIQIENLAGVEINDMNWLTTDNNTEQFIARGYDVNDVYVRDVWVNWAIAGNIGVLNATAGFEITMDCTTPGVGILFAYSGTLIDLTGDLTVSVGALATAAVTPGTATVVNGYTRNINVVGYDADGNIVPAGWDWTVEGGIGNVAPLTGSATTFTATLAGIGWVNATNASAVVVASAVITVEDPAIDFVLVEYTPTGTTMGDHVMTTDDILTVYANGYNFTYGLLGPALVNWETTGTLDADWLNGSASYTFDPVTANTYGKLAIEHATAFSMDSGIITVNVGALAAFGVTPAGATITADDEQQFTANGFDADGNLIGPVTANWDAENGTIDNAGLFTPWAIGDWNISANISGTVVNVTITVEAGALANLIITPDGALISTDDTQQFSIDGRDAKGNDLAISAGLIDWDAQNGVITAGGLYTPDSPGNWTIYAIVGSVMGTAVINVESGDVATIKIGPSLVSLDADGTYQFDVTGYDDNGNVVPGFGNSDVTWTATNGTISDGLFTPWSAGTWTITATNGTATATATVIVAAGAITSITISTTGGTSADANGTRDSALAVGEYVFFAATGLDARGNPTSLAGVVWTTTFGTISNGLFYAGTVPGSGIVTATYNSLITTEIISVVAGPLHHIDVSETTGTTVYIGDIETFNAAGFDIYGNPVPISAVTWGTTGGKGTIDASGVFSAAASGAGTITATADGVTGDIGIFVPQSEGLFQSWLWLVIVLAIVCVILLILLIIGRRKGDVEYVPVEAEDEDIEPEPEMDEDDLDVPPAVVDAGKDDDVEMAECPTCGSNIPEDASVCPECGEEFDEGVEEIEEDDLESEIEEDADLAELDDMSEEIPDTVSIDEERITACKELLDNADIYNDDRRELLQEMMAGASVKEFTKKIEKATNKKKNEEARISACRELLVGADIYDEDRAELNKLILEGITPKKLEPKIDDAVKKKKETEEKKKKEFESMSADERGVSLEDELAAELAALEDELEDDDDEDLEDKILKEIEDLENL